ncbi:hypothetical protein LguiB_013509 [Lonicera macranthoides]
MRDVVKGWIEALENMVKVVEKMSEKGETIETRLKYVVVRLRTPNGRDDWMYCHSQILIENSKYFADCLSDNWATCQILNSCSCVEVYCDESNFDYHVAVLRLFYVNITKCPLSELWNGVKNALCILRVAVEHGFPQIVSACVNYLESVTWEEAEEVEEEILKVIPGMGPLAEPILTHLRLVNLTVVVNIFVSAISVATSSLPLSMSNLKTLAQEQLENILTEDDDAPLLTADDEIKLEVREFVKRLLARFNSLIENLLCESEELDFEGGGNLIFSLLSQGPIVGVLDTGKARDDEGCCEGLDR